MIIEHKLLQLLPLKPRLVCLEKGQVVADVPAGETESTSPVWRAAAHPESAAEFSQRPPRRRTIR